MGAAGGRSVWQQALSAWNEAGLEWQRPAGWQPADSDLQRTEPIPVVRADVLLDDAAPAAADARPAGGRRPAAPGGSQEHGDDRAGRADGAGRAEQTGSAEGAGRAEGADGPEARGDREAASVQAAGREEAGGQGPAGTPEGGGEQGAVATGQAAAGLAAADPAATGQSATDLASTGLASTGLASTGLSSTGHPGSPGRHPRRSGRAAAVGAGICALLLAVAITGIIVTGSPGRKGSGLVAQPSARLADAQFAGPSGSLGQRVLPTLTGVAAVGRTVVAIGSQAALPATRPLMLTSADGGHTWQPAVLRDPRGAAAGPGAVPLMVAGGSGRWLAVGPGATWTSADGRSWLLGPAIAPVIGGDRVRALAQSGDGFIAVGENVHLRGSEVVRSPVLWSSANGLTWQRRAGAQIGLPTGPGQVVALRWAAARGGVLMVGGEIARTITRQHGTRKVSALLEYPGVWRSDGGGTDWVWANPPAGHGAATGLAGLAATGSGFVAIRPGHSPSGVRDAVAYVSTHGTVWRFAGALTARRGAALEVTTVAGSDQGAVAAGSAGRYQVAFVTVHGWSWRQTADLGRTSAGTVTGVTVGPGGKVVAAGASPPRPFLLLARGHLWPVGQAALAGAAAGGVSVSGLAASQGEQIAVGHAGSAAAIWARAGGGRWTRLALTTPAAWQGAGPGLTSAVHGSAGWLAVGSEGSPGGPFAPLADAGTLNSADIAVGQQPVLVTSADGHSWQPAAAGPLAAPGLTLTGAAAGPSGYVVVGVRDNHGVPGAALWWSANLTSWAPQGWWAGAVPPRSGESTVLAVAADRTGFAAVGAVGRQPAVWLSRDGRGWMSVPVPLPPGASSAVLTQVAVQGRRITAVGVQARASGPAPFAAVSTDGRTWRESDLPAPGKTAGVTALTTAGGGLVAAGTTSQAGSRQSIIWWSLDGLGWHAIRLTGTAPGGLGSLRITGLSASGTVLTGVGYAVTGTAQHPVLWQARIR